MIIIIELQLATETLHTSNNNELPSRRPNNALACLTLSVASFDTRLTLLGDGGDDDDAK
jgi:hypothetical protein